MAADWLCAMPCSSESPTVGPPVVPMAQELIVQLDRLVLELELAPVQER
jgi:hypothetical protein